MALWYTAAEGLSVVWCGELAWLETCGLECSGEVSKVFLVAVVCELPSAEVAGDGHGSVELLHDANSVCRVRMVGAYPLRAVGADGEDGDGGCAEAAVDVIKAGGSCGVSGEEDGGTIVGSDTEATPEGAVAVLWVAVAAAPMKGRGEGDAELRGGADGVPPVFFLAARSGVAVVAEQAAQA